MLQSTDPSSPCQRCPLPVNSSATTVCRSSLSDQCGLLEDVLPMRWDTLNGVTVKVPANPEAALRSHFGSTSARLINLKEIPRNYKYGSYRLVIGEANSDEIIIVNGSTTDGMFLSDDVDVVKSSDKLSAETTVTSALVETVKSPLLRAETTALPELQELQAERFISTISVSFVACLSIFGIALVYFFVFKISLHHRRCSVNANLILRRLFWY
ncbi:hypothetical protein FOZ60_000899 [Perkinsus olseni]|uniref:Uncharacterized protein n=1 Tax=Perkinsus olseni TaxID=32597 RepID=A0A7J6P2K1_PEROL|nr:hypothetical protein FOZ60_000899 [Perkinsus olseni]